MKIRMITLVAVGALLCQVASAQNPYGIKLNPGERLVSVNGKPVNGNYVGPQTAAKPAATPAKPATTAQPATTEKKATSTPATPASATKTTTPATQASATVTKHTVQKPVALSMYSGTDQERAQAEANYMAANGITGHVGSTIGRFEGCGWSMGGMPPTCTPGSGMTLTADAIAHGPRGVFRVRAWR
jgi:hypothetical protein